MALPKLSVAATATGASADVAGIFDDEPMCMHTTVPRLLAGGEERVPVPAVDAGQPEVGRDLAEADGAHAPRRVAPHLGRRLVGVPQRDEAQREQPAAAVAAPLLDHEVVVGDDAGLGQLLVLRLEEGLAAEAGKGREAQADASTQFDSLSAMRAVGS